jgi:hypothetical protein
VYAVEDNRIQDGFSMSGIEQTESRQLVERLAKRAVQAAECSFLASAGGAAAAIAAKIKELSSYNVYIVRAVELGEAGTLPVEFGEEFEAVNLAEAFLSQGQLAAGAIVLICRIGSKNVFYAKP